MYLYHAVVELGRIAHTIDTGDRRHHNHILAPREQGRGGTQAQLVNLVVDGKVLLYISIGRGYVCLGLVVVVVGDVVLYGVVGEEALHFAVELRGQRLVVAQYQRRSVDILDDIGNGERLARARHTQKCLCGNATQHSFSKLRNCFGLVTHWLIIRYEFKVHNTNI